MRGLIVKDLRLILKRKNFLVLFLAMGLFMCWQGGTGGLVYVTVVAAVFSMSTVSYDEYEKGYTFLMTLPFDRKTYVREKYLFAALAGVVAFLVSSVIFAAFLMIQGKGLPVGESFASMFVCLPVALLMADVMLPLQLKFGAEQGRIALLVVTAAVTMAAGIIAELFKGHVSSEAFLVMLSGMGEWGIVGGIAALCLLLTLLSYCASAHIMQKKEF